eukprot:g2638.t1
MTTILRRRRARRQARVVPPPDLGRIRGISLFRAAVHTVIAANEVTDDTTRHLKSVFSGKNSLTQRYPSLFNIPPPLAESNTFSDVPRRRNTQIRLSEIIPPSDLPPSLSLSSSLSSSTSRHNSKSASEIIQEFRKIVDTGDDSDKEKGMPIMLEKRPTFAPDMFRPLHGVTSTVSTDVYNDFIIEEPRSLVEHMSSKGITRSRGVVRFGDQPQYDSINGKKDYKPIEIPSSLQQSNRRYRLESEEILKKVRELGLQSMLLPKKRKSWRGLRNSTVSQRNSVFLSSDEGENEEEAYI